MKRALDALLNILFSYQTTIKDLSRSYKPLNGVEPLLFVYETNVLPVIL